MCRILLALATMVCAFVLPATAVAAPTPRFTWSPTSPTTGQAVTFDATTTGCERTSCRYRWEDDGPDGSGGTQWPLANPGSGTCLTSSCTRMRFTFTGAGTKRVRLRVTNSRGNSASVRHDVVVSSGPLPPPALDTDGDGTPDASDQCPNDPGPASNGGCPVPPPPADADGDGVPDSSDQCPNDPGPASNNGCPVTPPPPPPAGTCFTSPGSCGFPDPAYGNVGVPAGTTLTPSGSISVNTPGTVIDGRDVSGTITVNADNVTIKNSRITLKSGGCTSACGNSLIHISGAYDVTVSHVELTSDQGHTVEHAIRNTFGGTLHVDHAYQHGDVDALCHCGNADISDSYSVIYEAIPGDHLENMYVSDKTLTVTHNTLINREGQTANIFMDSGSGNHLTARSNLFAGGGWAMAVCPKNGCSTATAIVQNNMFTRCDHGNEVQGSGGTWVCRNGADAYGLFPRSGQYGRSANMPTQTTWSGNVWDDDGSTVPR